MTRPEGYFPHPISLSSRSAQGDGVREIRERGEPQKFTPMLAKKLPVWELSKKSRLMFASPRS